METIPSSSSNTPSGTHTSSTSIPFASLTDDDTNGLRTFLRRQAVKYHLKGDRQTLEDNITDGIPLHPPPPDPVGQDGGPAPLPVPERERVLQYKVGPLGKGCKLVQMNESHIDKCMEIQSACFEPHHCEDRQSYVDRMKLFNEGMVVLMVPTEPTEQEPTVQWEIAGYVLYQPFFKGDIYDDGDTEKLEEAIAAYQGRGTARQADCLYTHELSISPKFRGKGLTTPLTAFVEEQAMSRGFDWLTLVSLPNPHAFWKKNGYQTKEEIDYGGVPCFYMEKRIARLS